MYLRIFQIVLMLFSTLLFSSCKKETPIEVEKNTSYIGQNPPGIVPVKFVPNSNYTSNSSWWWNCSPAFSPDGKEMYFAKYLPIAGFHEIWYTKLIGEEWTSPQKASFSTSSFDSSPMFCQSSDTLYFFSTRSGGFIFRTTRISTGWSEPTALNIPLPQNFVGGQSFNITKNKTVYFSMMQNITGDYQAMYKSADIYKSQFINDQYTPPENISALINSDDGESVGYVDPDERFMIFESKRAGGYGLFDMYFSSRNQNGSWSNPVNLGNRLNSAAEDYSPKITPDGKYFFFTTVKSGDNGYTPYWVDATFLDALK